jgi:hypothetical protein
LSRAALGLGPPGDLDEGLEQVIHWMAARRPPALTRNLLSEQADQ